MDTSEVMKSKKNYLILEGIITVLLGLIVLIWPGLTLATVIIYVGIYGLIHGIVLIFKGFAAEKGQSDRALSVVMGILSILFGFLVLNVPEAFATFALVLIAILIGVQGVYYLVSCFSHNKEPMGSRVLLFIAGLLSIVFTFWVIANPKAGALALMFYLSIMLIFSGSAILAVGASIESKK